MNRNTDEATIGPTARHQVSFGLRYFHGIDGITPVVLENGNGIVDVPASFRGPQTHLPIDTPRDQKVLIFPTAKTRSEERASALVPPLENRGARCNGVEVSGLVVFGIQRPRDEVPRSDASGQSVSCFVPAKRGQVGRGSGQLNDRYADAPPVDQSQAPVGKGHAQESAAGTVSCIENKDGVVRISLAPKCNSLVGAFCVLVLRCFRWRRWQFHSLPREIAGRHAIAKRIKGTKMEAQNFFQFDLVL
mmetsp:Transcript_16499/g.37774  ORF Transcript_16499/g.37774 Transcript_16499/m.37774 type:complete len:247 (-) Transcript_16499:397-1137(-)